MCTHIFAYSKSFSGTKSSLSFLNKKKNHFCFHHSMKFVNVRCIFVFPILLFNTQHLHMASFDSMEGHYVSLFHSILSVP